MTPARRHYYKYRDVINAKRRRYRLEHPSEVREEARIYRISHREKVEASLRKYRIMHRRTISDRAHLRWLNRTGDQIVRDKLRNQRYRARHKEKFLQAHRAWVNANRTKWNRYMNEYEKRRIQKDMGFKLLKALCSRIRMAIKRITKCGSTTELLGCDIIQVRRHLESMFQSGMSWDNYGNTTGCWSIDHIRPCASFDLTKPDHQKACFHFSNLQPLWHIENMRKSDFLPKDKQP